MHCKCFNGLHDKNSQALLNSLTKQRTSAWQLTNKKRITARKNRIMILVYNSKELNLLIILIIQLNLRNTKETIVGPLMASEEREFFILCLGIDFR